MNLTERIIIFWIIVLVSLMFWIANGRAQTPPPTPTPKLVHVTQRMYVNLSEIDYVNFPNYNAPCPGCAARWGGHLAVRGQEEPLEIDAELELERLLDYHITPAQAALRQLFIDELKANGNWIY